MHSTRASAAVTVMISLVSVIVSPPLLALSGSVLEKISTHLAEGSPQAAKRSLWAGVLLSLGVCCCCCGLVYLVAADVAR